jgi:hypothetical protein
MGEETVPLFDGSTQRRESSESREGENSPLEELTSPIPHGNLTKGIVWADILADIAADEEARQRRDLPDAA